MKNTTLTPEQHADIDRAIVNRLLSGPASAGALSQEVELKVGIIRGYEFFRHVDRWLQRSRKNGLVSFVRDGRAPSWSFTTAGLDHFNAAIRTERTEASA